MKLKGRKLSQNVTRATNTTGKSGRSLPAPVYTGKPATKLGNKAGLGSLQSPMDKVKKAFETGAFDRAIRKKSTPRKGTK